MLERLIHKTSVNEQTKIQSKSTSISCKENDVTVKKYRAASGKPNKGKFLQLLNSF